MKSIYLSFTLFACLSSLSLGQEEVVLKKFDIFEGNPVSLAKSLQFTVTAERLKATPSWDGTSKLPLSVDQALEAAKKHFKTRYPDAKFSLDELELDHEKIGAQHESRWYYAIKLQRGTVPATDTRFLILMDGSIVAPKIVAK